MAFLATHEADLVLLDIRLMDGSSGIDVAEHLVRSSGPGFIFLTANAEELPGDLGGAIGVLPKPFTAERLVTTLGYLQEGLRDPPPATKMPYGLRLSPHYALSWT